MKDSLRVEVGDGASCVGRVGQRRERAFARRSNDGYVRERRVLWCQEVGQCLRGVECSTGADGVEDTGPAGRVGGAPLWRTDEPRHAPRLSSAPLSPSLPTRLTSTVVQPICVFT